MLIVKRWFVIPVGCHTIRMVKNNVGLDLIDNSIRSGDVTV